MNDMVDSTTVSDFPQETSTNKQVERLRYDNKMILAPMVRVGTLPMRLLALRYGADIVYTEEIIDWKFLRSVRRINVALGTIDYMDKTDGTIVFRTVETERTRLVVQLGTSDPDRALRVARMIENDIAGIDINMGCPKEFSVKGGMGVALLMNIAKAKDVLSTLVRNVNIPVTCKIRVLENEADTLTLVKELASTGISAIAVHGRTKDERPRHPNRNYMIKLIAESINIPVIANGGSREIEKYSDIEKFKQECGASSVMIARTAQGNCSIFRREGLKNIEDVIYSYLKLAVDFDNSPNNTKYCVQNILKELQETRRGKQFLDCQTLEQICGIWDLDTYCREKELKNHKLGMLSRRAISPNMFEPTTKKLKTEIVGDVNEIRCAFIRANYCNDFDLPKSLLIRWCTKNQIKKPTYEIIHEGKLFRAILSLDGKKYSSTYWEKNKKFAEQGAALACTYFLGLVTKEDLVENRSILI